MALDPDQPYDVLAINTTSLSTHSGLPFSLPRNCGPRFAR